ncbi:MAG: efflux RND transporter periplasmic adaptor subunit [Desulfotomaculum sp.]|nr:efflux RND transporter periplasmic adaptor subunit [Desulfotomaculum sp.]
MRRVTLLTVLILFSALFLTGCNQQDGTETVLPEMQQPEAIPVPVEVVPAVRVDLKQAVALTGEVIASSEIAVAAEVSGKVAAVHVKAGQPVRAGQLLFELENNDAQQRLRLEEATLLMRQISLELEQNNWARISQLDAAAAISKVELEQAETTLKLAQAQLDQSQISLDIVQDSYHKLAVTAPAGGIVDNLNIAVGAMAGPQAVALKIIDLNPAVVKLNLSENIVGQVALGQEVTVAIRAVNKTVVGKIRAVAPQIDNVTKAFPVEIEISNAGGEILAGMVATANISTGQIKDALVVPPEAVLMKNGLHKIFVLADGVAEERKVTVGETTADKTQILTGLAAGEQVVVAGNRLVSAGQKVQVVSTDEDS